MNLCLMALLPVTFFAFGLAFVHHTKTSLKREKLDMPQNQSTTLKCTHQDVAYAKFHKALHTWQ